MIKENMSAYIYFMDILNETKIKLLLIYLIKNNYHYSNDRKNFEFISIKINVYDTTYSMCCVDSPQ